MLIFLKEVLIMVEDVEKKDAIQALKEYTDTLRKLPNVRGIGVRRKSTHENSEGAFCVKVYVSKKFPIKKLRKDEIVPKQLTIIKKNGGMERKVSVNTEVEEIGEIELE